MKKIAGSLKLELAQYREVEAFTQFGSDLDATTLRSLNRGVRLIELLKQPQYQPQDIRYQLLIIYAGMAGLLDAVDVKRINNMEHLVKMFSCLFPAVFCQLPLTKTAQINDKVLLPRMKEFLRELTVLLLSVVDSNENTMQILVDLIKRPNNFWGCVETFNTFQFTKKN